MPGETVFTYGALKQHRLLATAPKTVTGDDLAAILTDSMENW